MTVAFKAASVVSNGSGGTTALLSVSITIPGSVVSGDLGLICVSWVGGAGDVFIPDAPWTILIPMTINGTMYSAVAIRQYQAGDNANPSMTINTSTGRFITAQGYWWSGMTSSLVQVGTLGVRSAATPTITVAPGLPTTVGQTVAILGFERTTASETDITSISPGTERAFAAQAGTATCTIMAADLVSTASASSDVTITYPNTQTANGMAVQVALSVNAIIEPKQLCATQAVQRTSYF